jgi:hypothetical protein
MVKLSKTSKLDGVPSWGLPASICPDTTNSAGEMVDVCKICYARQGRFNFKQVDAVRWQNLKDYLKEEWVAAMVFSLQNHRYMRWFCSGDIVSEALARKILEICRRTPWCQHWIPTRAYKRPRVREVLEQLKQLPNVVVRYSSDSIHGDYELDHGSTVVPSENWNDPNLFVCPAYQNKGKCNGCRRCWDKATPVVAYVAHGQKSKVFYRSQMADVA